MQTYHDTIQSITGDIITTSTVTVYDSLGALANIFADDETTALNNPFTVSDTNYDTNGSFWFKADNGAYDIKVVSGAVTDWKNGVYLTDSTIMSISRDDKADAVQYQPLNGKMYFIGGTDGGWFKGVTGAAAGTYSDNGGSYCGTVFIPTGGDGSKGWVRVDEGYITVEMFGAIGDNSTDDITAINLATTFSKVSGKAVYLNGDKIYKITSTINIYNGVRLLGESDGYNGTGGSALGSVIKNYGTGAAITVLGAYGFELGYFHITSDTPTTDDGIYLVKDGSTVPRTGSIHHISIKDVGRDCLRLDAFSYIDIFQVQAVLAGQHGFNIVDDSGAALKEYLYIDKSKANSCVGDGLHIGIGSFMYISNFDTALNDKGVYINGDVFRVDFDHLSTSQNTTTEIDIYAESDNITRINFDRSVVHMKGTDAGQRAIYVRRSASNVCTQILFDGVDISKNGATSPTTAIDLGYFNNCEILNYRNAAGGLVTFTSTHRMMLSDVDKKGLNYFTASDATPTVLGGSVFRTNNSGATTLTDFDDGYYGQVVDVLFMDSNTTVDFTGAGFRGNAGVDWTPSTFDSMRCVLFDGTTWICDVSDNTL